MKRLLFIALFLVGCAGQNLEDTGVQTGLSPFTTGGTFTADDANALRIATDSKQDYHANLDTWSGIAPSANAQSLLATDYAGMRTQLGLVPGTDVLTPTGDGSGLTGITTIESDPLFAAKETGYDNHVIDADKHPLSTSGADSLTLPVARPNLILPGNLTAKSSTYELTTVLPASPVDNQRIVTDGAVLQVYAEQGTDIWGYFWCDACDSGAGQWVAEWNYTEGARITSTSSSGSIAFVDAPPASPADDTCWIDRLTGLFSCKIAGATLDLPMVVTPDPVYPTYVGGTVAVGGLTSVIEFSEEVTFSGYAQDLTMTCASSNGGAPFYLLQPSPEVGTPEIVNFAHFDDAIASNTVMVYQGDTCTISFAGTTGSIVDADLLDMAAFGPSAIVNSSTEPEPLGATYLINEDAEGVGTPSGWTDGGGTVEWDYTGNTDCTAASTPYVCCTGSGTGTCPDVLRGTESLACIGSYSSSYKSFTAVSGTIDAFFRFNPSVLPASSFKIFKLRSGTTELASLRLNSDGSIRAAHGTVTGDSAAGKIVAGTPAYIWISRTPATDDGTPDDGTMTVYIGSSVVKPAASISITTGTSLLAVDNVMMQKDGTDAGVFTFDQILVDDVTIGDVDA